jgi:GrpB-like predicted nucleotidyltransferase (UPF0157 family)
MQIDEPIIIVDYNPEWPHIFCQEHRILKNVLDKVVVEIEHFGSTSVPGLKAKPIIDILAGIESFDIPDDYIGELEDIGYEYCGEAGVSNHLYFRKRSDKCFDVAVVEWNGEIWKDNLLLRDFLRAHPDEAKAYAEYKHTIFIQGAKMLSQYSQLKSPVIEDLLRRASLWKNSRRQRMST